MSLVPEFPPDQEVKKIIDKFAQYVAKNGPGFEEITRQKQYDNPKFAFLFGREYSDYYRFKLMVEIQNLAIINKDSSGSSTGNFIAVEPGTSQSNEQKISELRKQIEDSESNLKAQKQVLNLQKQAKSEALYTVKETQQIYSLIKQVGMDIALFESFIDHMSTSGSKDTISNSKKWIFDNCQTDQLREVILTYLLYRVRMSTANDALRLHILYLINDWAHYCQRKKLDNIRQMLSRYVPKLYAYASSSATLDRSCTEKLDKLIGVWEGYKYFDENCYKQLRSPVSIMETEQAQLFAQRQSAADEVERELEETYKGYEKQHQEFERHIRTQIAELEMLQKREHEAQQQEMEQKKQQESSKRRSRFDQGPNSSAVHDTMGFSQNGGSVVSTVNCVSTVYSANHPLPRVPSSSVGTFNMAVGGPSAAFPTLEEELIPKCPYYELPAGMMVPLVAEEDCTFKMLDSKKLRIPPPASPNGQLLGEIDRFYAMHTTPDHPRDPDGWEVNGLTEHFKRKSLYRQKIDSRMREQGKTFKDAIENRFVPPTPMEEKANEKRRSRSRSISKSRSRSRSHSSSSTSSTGSSTRSRTRSRSSSTSRSPKIKRERSLSPEEMRAGFGGTTLTPTVNTFVPKQPIMSFKTPTAPLNRDQNKGAQLMAKMGWEGRGLGVKEQGIEEPIHAGEVRDFQDQYRGIGSKADIFDEYRKQMSARKSAGYRRRHLE